MQAAAKSIRTTSREKKLEKKYNSNQNAWNIKRDLSSNPAV